PWFPNCAWFLANATQARKLESIWMVSLAGGVPRRLRDGAHAWSISPDGSSIAFATADLPPLRIDTIFLPHDVWLMDSNGTHPHKVFATDQNETVASVQWSPDGQRVAYLKLREVSGKSETSIESRAVKGGPPSSILSDTRS